MTTSWLILKADYAHETRVCDAIAAQQFPAWVPAELLIYRTARDRASNTWTRRLRPIVPGLVLVRSAWTIPIADIKHAIGFERDEAGRLLSAPDDQVMAFRVAIDALNSGVEMLTRLQRKRRGQAFRSFAEAFADEVGTVLQSVPDRVTNRRPHQGLHGCARPRDPRHPRAAKPENCPKS